MSIDGPIESFSPFHNINCPKGFLYFNKQVAETEESKMRVMCSAGPPPLKRAAGRSLRGGRRNSGLQPVEMQGFGEYPLDLILGSLFRHV